MSVKITVQKEISIDLNAYWDEFPRKLRDQILDHVTATLSTDKKGFTRQTAARKSWAADNDGFKLCHPNRHFRISGQEPAKGKARALYCSIRNRFDENEFTASELREFLVGQGIEDDKVTTVISNLWSNGNLFANRLS